MSLKLQESLVRDHFKVYNDLEYLKDVQIALKVMTNYSSSISIKDNDMAGPSFTIYYGPNDDANLAIDVCMFISNQVDEYMIFVKPIKKLLI